jgi:hypothetical protein
MNAGSTLDIPISFGTHIKQPGRLETRTARDVLFGIRDGEWKDQVEKVRSFPADSSIQRRAKSDLPYALWSGRFSRRNSDSLIEHSGLIGVDLDSLDADRTRRVMHTAMDDPFCAAAFRSARGEGVRLIFRGPAGITAAGHGPVFDASADYVREHYQVEPDACGRDVCRASFMSFDGGLWLNSQAKALPVQFPDVTQRTRCVTRLLPVPAVPWWEWTAREFLPYRQKPDGSALTHHTLLHLGRRLALRIERERAWRVAEDLIIPAAAAVWLEEAKTLWLNRKPERVFDSGCKGGLSAEADRSTMLKDPPRSWVVDNR